MADSQKYTAGETLCRVLNAGEDALKVDIDNVTLITEGSDINIEVHTDKAEDSMMMWTHTVKTGTGGTSYVPLIDSDGHLQVDTLSSALPSGAATAANQATIIGHVDGLETLITSTNSKIDTLDAVQDNALTKLGEIETTNNANQVLLGTIDADTGAIKTAVEVIDNAISGSEMQVDVVAALPAGSNTIGVVDLGSTDNAVLDAMVVDLAEIEVATEASQAALEKMLYGNALAVTAVHGGDTHALGATYEALYVGVGGNVVVTMVGTGNFTFSNVASGQLLPIRITHVINTNTTATNMIALKA